MIDPGTKLGSYLINRELGRGGMAFVYHAVDERSGGEVAIKVLAPGHAHNPGLVSRFEQEGEIALRLRHPNIVRAHDAGILEGYHYIVLDYAAKGTLSTLIEARQTPFSLEECVHVLRRVALALDYAHSRDVLHRDVKPSNILLGANGQVWLADFGIARRLDRGSAVFTLSNQTIGTPSFMSPEQVRHERSVDGRSDIYSLGVVAYYLLSGGMPFQAETPVSLLHQIAYERPVSPRQHNVQMPAGTAYVLERVLAKDPAERYNTAAAFIEALQTSLTLIPSKADWAQLRHEKAPPAEPVAEPTQVRVQPPAPPRKSPPAPRQRQGGLGQWVGWLIALAALVLVALFAFLWSVPRPTAPTAPTMASATPIQLAPLNATSTVSPTLALTPTVALPGAVAPTLAAVQATATLVPPPATLPPSLKPTPTKRSLTPPSVVKPPTSTPVSENTATPTSRAKATATAVSGDIGAARVGQSQVPPTKVTGYGIPNVTGQLIFPVDGAAVSGSSIFQWQASASLPEGYAFEAIFWPVGSNPMTDGRGWGGSTRETSVSINLTKFVNPGSYLWGVRLVAINPYRPIELISNQRRITVGHLEDASSGERRKSPLPTPSGGN